MEVFLRHVPQDLTEDGLRRELAHSIEALGAAAWSCRKPRKKQHAWVLFLNKDDGVKFLETHGKIVEAKVAPSSENAVGRQTPAGQNRRKPHPLAHPPSHARGGGGTARLHITGKPVFVEKSTRPIREYALHHQQHERAAAPERASKQRPVTFGITTIACGKNVFTGSSQQLTFAQQSLLFTFSTGKLTQRSMSVVCSESFRMDIPFDIVHDFIARHADRTFTLVLIEPPRIFSKVNQNTKTNVTWERQTFCRHWRGHDNYVAHCLVYQFAIAEQHFDDIVGTIEHRDLISVTRDTLPVDKNPKPFVDDYASSMDVFKGKIHGHQSRSPNIPFPLLFQVQALVTNNYLHPYAGSQMIDLLEQHVKGLKYRRNAPLPLTVESMKKVFHDIPYPSPGTDPSELDIAQLVERAIQMETDLRRDDLTRHSVYGTTILPHQAWVMKAMVTPTRIIFHGPEPESKNRVLRMFPDHTDYFIRCLFCDDDGQDLSFNPKVSNEVVYERYRIVLREGLHVAGRRYSFLGFSHSSLRSHSVWFMAPFTDHDFTQQTCDTIIQSLGNFDDIRVPAKCAARIGQAFSETPYSIPILESKIQSRYIPDIKNKDGTRVFSDGNGTISYDAMQEFWQRLPERAAAATCFQIRWGGTKGLLSYDERLKGKVICIRKESMLKFESRDLKELGICDTASKPMRLMLNRQMIKILEDMGTDNSWFLKLQTEEVKFLRAVTSTAPNTSTFLRYQLVGINVGFPQFIKQLDGMGIDYRRDVFLKTVVEHVVLRELRLLKHKARIPVKHGVTLFGIMDETGYLEPEEIYVAFDQNTSQIAPPPSATTALITRSPALHPGDIRCVRMVTPPAGSPLLKLRNCVVFSQKGDRDLPSQLSGGDLDGDLYNVIWDPEAMPKRQFAAADYPRVSPKPLSRRVTSDDIADFFINFMKTDVLGVIATRHQIMADVMNAGTLDPSCIKLAELHSTAVDSSKTGLPVDTKAMPKAPTTRPDFLAPAPPLVTFDIGEIDHIGLNEDADSDDDGMGSAKRQYYRSDKILGRLYRDVDEQKIWAENISQTVDRRGPTVWKQLLEMVDRYIRGMGLNINCERQFNQAWRIRNHYESAVADMMMQFSENPRVPITEVEVFCGFILNKRGSQTRRQRDSSTKLREEMDRVMSWISSMIRDRTQAPSQESVVELCLACVHVGCTQDKTNAEGYYGDFELKTFKVLASCCLLREMNVLAMLSSDTGGGYVGVGSRQRQTTLPLR